MKHILDNTKLQNFMVLLLMLIITPMANGQGIGAALSNGTANTGVHSIGASDLKAIFTKNNFAEINKYLSSLKWKYSSQSKEKTLNGESATIYSWALDPSYYGDMANAWFYVYIVNGRTDWVRYRFKSEKLIQTFSQTIQNSGFTAFDYSGYGENFDHGYQGKNLILFLSSDDNVYCIDCIRKCGAYDELNGKRRENLDDGGYVEYTVKNGKPVGLVEYHDNDGTLTHTVTIQNGLLNGEWKAYHKNGKVSILAYYKDGKLNGRRTEYNDSGNIISERYYDNDELTKETIYDKPYNGTSRVAIQTIYDRKNNRDQCIVNFWDYERGGVLSGRGIEGYSDGYARFKLYKFNEKDSLLVQDITVKNENCTALITDMYPLTVNSGMLWATYDKYGVTFPSSIFSEDPDTQSLLVIDDIPLGSVNMVNLKSMSVNGKFSCYVDSSLYRKIYIEGTITDREKMLPKTTDTSKLQLYLTGTYKDNLRVGMWKLFNPVTGKLLMTLNYMDGIIAGNVELLGDFKTEKYKFSKGVANGLYEYQDKYGLKIQGCYKDGKPYGKWVWSKGNSKERAEVVFSDGKLSGNARYTNDNGALVNSITYRNGAHYGITQLYDVDGNKVFDVKFTNGKVDSITDIRSNKYHSITYTFPATNTVCVKVDDGKECTTVNYHCNAGEIKLSGMSTIEVAETIDGLWANKALVPNGEITYIDSLHVMRVKGTIVENAKTGEWTFSFPEQGMNMSIDYTNGIKRFTAMDGTPWKGKFEYIDQINGIMESIKVNDGAEKSVKRYSTSNGKKIKEDVSVDYFPVKFYNGTYLISHVPNMEAVSEQNQKSYNKLSDNKLSILDSLEPSYAYSSDISKIIPFAKELIGQTPNIHTHNFEQREIKITPDSPTGYVNRSGRDKNLMHGFHNAFNENNNTEEKSPMLFSTTGEKKEESYHTFSSNVETTKESAYNRDYSVDDDGDDEIVIVPDERPSFIGGEEKLYEYLAKNLKYPDLARDGGITGKVYVQFVVEKDGSITNVSVIRDIGGGCGAEASRVVWEMPKWNPGKKNGRKVRSQFILPINFTLK